MRKVLPNIKLYTVFREYNRMAKRVGKFSAQRTRAGALSTETKLFTAEPS